MCQICGQPDFIRCNCQSQQPLCNQCAPNNVCGGGFMDSSCVIYHLLNQSPTKLINLGLSNGTPVETVLESIDTYLGKIKGTFIVPENTNSINLILVPDGFGNSDLFANLNISHQSGNTAIINSDGLYVPDLRDWKVKINSTDFPGYLLDKVVGGTDGIVSISAILDPSGSNLVAFLPSIDIIALANNTLFDLTLAHNSYFVSQLISPDSGNIIIQHSNGLYATSGSTTVISPDAGNIIVQHSNGIYASGATENANNGLSVSANIIQLGGSLIKDTTIDFASAHQLNFINSPFFNIGGSASLAGAELVFVNDLNSASIIPIALNVQSTRTLSNSVAYLGSNAFLEIVGPTFTQTGSTFNDASAGQLWWNASGDQIMATGQGNSYSGINGVVIKSGSTNLSGNITSGGYFSCFATNSGNISDMAGVRIAGLQVAPSGTFGPSFTGTLTNYYGLYVEDIPGSAYGSRITNKYGAFINGSGGGFENVVVQDWTVTSDERIKENILPLKYGIDEVKQLQPVYFNFIDDETKDLNIGFIAQEVEKILPEAVSKKPLKGFDDFRLLDKNVIYATLVNAVKQLISITDSLNYRIASLEEKINKSN